MILIDIKKFIQDQKEVTLPQLSRQFNVPDEVMKDMVKRWVDKGLVDLDDPSHKTIPILSDNTCQTGGCGSGGCGSCSFKDMGVVIKYRWHDC